MKKGKAMYGITSTYEIERALAAVVVEEARRLKDRPVLATKGSGIYVPVRSPRRPSETLHLRGLGGVRSGDRGKAGND